MAGGHRAVQPGIKSLGVSLDLAAAAWLCLATSGALSTDVSDTNAPPWR